VLFQTIGSTAGWPLCALSAALEWATIPFADEDMLEHSLTVNGNMVAGIIGPACPAMRQSGTISELRRPVRAARFEGLLSGLRP